MYSLVRHSSFAHQVGPRFGALPFGGNFSRRRWLAISVDKRQTLRLLTTSSLVDFVVDREPRRLTLQQEMALFRIGQEALTNVQKHADCDVAGVRLDFMEEAVCLCVTDGGRSFTQSRDR